MWRTTEGLEPQGRGGYSGRAMAGETSTAGGGRAGASAPLYPAEVHFRIVVEGRFAGEAALEAVLAAYAVTAPLAAASRSSTGRFRSLQVSVCVQGLEELTALDRALRAVEGVRLLL